MDSCYKLHTTKLRYSVYFSNQERRLLMQSPSTLLNITGQIPFVLFFLMKLFSASVFRSCVRNPPPGFHFLFQNKLIYISLSFIYISNCIHLRKLMFIPVIYTGARWLKRTLYRISSYIVYFHNSAFWSILLPAGSTCSPVHCFLVNLLLFHVLQAHIFCCSSVN